MKHKMITAAALLSAALLLSSCGEDTPKVKDSIKISGQTMGTFYSLTVIPGQYEHDEAKLKKIAEDEFQVVIDAISSFDPNSEISRFNKWNSTEPLKISKYLGDVIQEVNRQALRVDGVLDISVAPLVNLWGFGPQGRPEKVPTQEQIDAVRPYVGIDKYKVNYIGGMPFLEKADPRVQLDLSTVGEGLGVDRLAAKLDEGMVSDYLVSIAGAVRTRGTNPEGKDWKVGIVNPLQPDGQPFEIVCPHGMAMSTSGSYRNYFVDENGKRYSHIIDPRTGYPIDHHTVSVTVIDRAALVTDTLDTGLMVLGADAALKWGDEHEIAVYTIEIKDGKPVGRHNRYFEPYLKCDAKDAR